MISTCRTGIVLRKGGRRERKRRERRIAAMKLKERKSRLTYQFQPWNDTVSMIKMSARQFQQLLTNCELLLTYRTVITYIHSRKKKRIHLN
jgi:hypothetical protein